MQQLASLYFYAVEKIAESELWLLYYDEVMFHRLIRKMCKNGIPFSLEKAKVSKTLLIN